MKKVYQKPEVWVETFVMDASIAAGCTKNEVSDIMLDAWEQSGITDFDEFLRLYSDGMGDAQLCEHTATAMYAPTIS